MPGFMDMMRQRFGGGRLPLQGGPALQGSGSQMMQGPQPQPPPMFSGGGMDYGMLPMNSGIVRPGQLGGFEEFQAPEMSAPPAPPPMQPKPMMRGMDDSAVRRPNRPGRGRKLGQGGEPVF